MNQGLSNSHRGAVRTRWAAAYRGWSGYARAYLGRVRIEIGFASLLALLALLLGYGFGWAGSSQAAALIDEVAARLGALAGGTELETFLAIFGNNLNIDLGMVVLGFLGGVIPFAVLVLNAFVIGLFGAYFTQLGLGPAFLLGILPHGVIEIPCLVLSAAVGLRLGAVAWRKLFGRGGELTEELADGLRFAVYVILPLTFLAAVVETWITPRLLELFAPFLGLA